MIISSDVKREDEKLQEGIANSVLAVGKTRSFQQLCLQYGKHPKSASWDLRMGLNLCPYLGTQFLPDRKKPQKTSKSLSYHIEHFAYFKIMFLFVRTGDLSTYIHINQRFSGTPPTASTDKDNTEHSYAPLLYTESG